jgi:uncharacterized protein (TIGR00288 family)
MQQSKEKIALFIDADNAPAAKIDEIVSDLARYGAVTIKRAYGNWKKDAIKPWEDCLHTHAIQPIQQFDLIKGKNATDIALTIDAMDVLYTKDVDIFALASSDCDFTPLVTRILSEGKTVLGYGERKASDVFVNSCSRFLFLEPNTPSSSNDSVMNGDEPANSNAASAINGNKPKSLNRDTKLVNILRDAIESSEDSDGWCYLGKIGTYISNISSFDPRNYGYKKLSDLVKDISLFETKYGPNNSQLFVRDIKKAKKAAGISKK